MEEKKEKQKTLNIEQVFALYIFDNITKLHLKKKFGNKVKTEFEWRRLIQDDGFELKKFE